MLSPATRASCLLTRRSSVLVVHEQMKTDTFVVEMGKRELPCASPSVHAHALAVQYPKNNHAHVRSAVLRLAETRNAVCVRRMCGGQDEDPTSTACRRMRGMCSRRAHIPLFLVYRPTSLDSGDSVSQRTGSGVRAHRHRARDSARSARGLAPPASPTHPPTRHTLRARIDVPEPSCSDDAQWLRTTHRARRRRRSLSKEERNMSAASQCPQMTRSRRLQTR